MSKKKPISLSVDQELHELLRISAKKENMNISELVRNLIEKHLDLVVNDGEEIPIILKVPSTLRGDEAGLRSWLQVRLESIISVLKK